MRGEIAVVPKRLPRRGDRYNVGHHTRAGRTAPVFGLQRIPVMKRNSRRFFSLALASVFSAFSGLAASAAEAPSTNLHEAPNQSSDIVDTAMAAPNFKTLVTAIKAAGLVDALKGKGPFTVFAPTDEAFEKLPKGTVETLLKPENKDKLAGLLKYHVIQGSVMAKDVKTMTAVTLQGQAIDVVVKDKSVMIDKAKVTKTDIACSNGVIHVIDAVIMPADKDIVDTAVGAGTFKTLATLLDKAGLVNALKGKGPFTVFAPTDDAFAKLPKETVESLLMPENKEKLAGILKFHVVEGRVYSGTAAKGATVKTLQGSNVTTQSSSGKVMVENANVVTADLDASNGVIHVIDTVIMPKP